MCTLYPSFYSSWLFLLLMGSDLSYLSLGMCLNFFCILKRDFIFGTLSTLRLRLPFGRLSQPPGAATHLTWGTYEGSLSPELRVLWVFGICKL